MGRVGSPYEVRCLRCDVSFPPEARRCIHCGGPTSSADAGASIGVDSSWLPPIGGSEPAPIGSAPPAPDEAAPAAGRSLVRSFGSVLWVVALVVFLIARSCSEG